MTVISAMPDDTVQACRDRSNTGDMIEAYISAAYYVNGMGKPHYQVPAIPRIVKYGSWFVMLQDTATCAVYLFKSRVNSVLYWRDTSYRQSKTE